MAVVGIWGDDKTGKTTLGLSAPKPLVHFDLDVGGFDRAKVRLERLGLLKQVVSEAYYLPQQAIINKVIGVKQSPRLVGIKELWYKLLEQYVKALEDSSVSTIMFDSFSQVWELCRLGFLQEKQEAQPTGAKVRESLMPIEYAEPNARMRALIYASRQMGKNLVLTHYLTDLREDKIVNGEVVSVVVGKTYAGWKYLEKEADIVVETYVKREKNKPPVPACRVHTSGYGLAAVGLEIEEPTWDKIMQLTTSL